MITRSPETAPDLLSAWARLLDGVLEGADASAGVRGLADDSRAVERGFLFFARRGSTDDGRRYARDATRRGAIAVVSEEGLSVDLPVLRVANAERALCRAADAWYGCPQDALRLVGVTGTKGKTTTAWLTAAALRQAGVKTATFGTIAHDLGDGERVASRNTTPGRLELRRLLAEARDRGCRAAVLEVSSHALDQGRVDGLAFRSAVFTNLGRDHLDYHESLEAYFEAKRRLFSGLGEGATAILNRDDEWWWQLAGSCRGRVLTYGRGPEADLRADDIHATAEGTRFRLVVADTELDVTTALVGRFNVLNLLAAVGAARGLGVDVVAAVRGAASVRGVPGRLERIEFSGDLHVFVDYAHTEEALSAVLGFLRDIGSRPLICVVGCGGDRDSAKRPRMARTAAELCDAVVFTSDNPRTEDPHAILRDMERGVPPGLLERTTTVVDRREALSKVVAEAPAGACILVAGKGHESYQILGTKKVPFDDAEEVRRALARRLCVLEGAEPRASARVT